MSADVAARLRELAHDHHDGRLDLAAYRALRAPLLDALVQHAVVAMEALEVTQPRAVSTVTLRAIAEEKPSKPFPVKWVAILVAVIGLAAGAAWLLKGSRHENTAGTADIAVGPDQVLDLVDPFMDRADWSDGRLTTLNAALLEVGRSQISAVASNARFQRFVDELRLRLKEQQALSATPLTADNSPLAALAVTVGIDLNSPDSALHITAPPAAPPPEISPEASKAEVSPVGTRHAAEHAVTPPTAGAASQAAAGANTVSTDSTTSPSAAQNNVPDAARDGAGNPARSYAPGGAVTGIVSNAAATAPNNYVGRNSGPGGVAANGVNAGSASSASSAGNQANAGDAANASSVTGSRETTCRLDLIGSRRPVCHDTLFEGVDGPQLALIPAGAFDMGSTAASEEQPVHRVTIREPFAISVYEVSQGEFRQYCEHAKRPCAAQPWVGDDYPVVNVSWDDARGYTEWLSATTHHRYSLPTEAQWEYAARAGRTGAFPSGDALSPTDAQFSAATKQTAAARRSQTFNPNSFRLLHTVGNVREWVEDTWTQNFSGAPTDGSAVKSTQQSLHVVRGGSYADTAARLRLSLRESLPPGTRDTTTGFRIVRELP